MTAPDDWVQIPQSELDRFTGEFERIKGELVAYIQQLLANQAGPLANEAGLNQALADLDALAPPIPPTSDA